MEIQEIAKLLSAETLASYFGGQFESVDFGRHFCGDIESIFMTDGRILHFKFRRLAINVGSREVPQWQFVTNIEDYCYNLRFCEIVSVDNPNCLVWHFEMGKDNVVLTHLNDPSNIDLCHLSETSAK